MADKFLVLIPASATIELPETANALRNALAECTGSREARVKNYERVQFIDCGVLPTRRLCPDCGAGLSLEWWGQQMDHCWDEELGFNLHANELPCCASSKALDELTYEPHQGFARWIVSARNPGRGPLSKSEVSKLEMTAGIPLRAIAQSY